MRRRGGCRRTLWLGCGWMNWRSCKTFSSLPPVAGPPPRPSAAPAGRKAVWVGRGGAAKRATPAAPAAGEGIRSLRRRGGCRRTLWPGCGWMNWRSCKLSALFRQSRGPRPDPAQRPQGAKRSGWGEEAQRSERRLPLLRRAEGYAACADEADAVGRRGLAVAGGAGGAVISPFSPASRGDPVRPAAGGSVLGRSPTSQKATPGIYMIPGVAFW